MLIKVECGGGGPYCVRVDIHVEAGRVVLGFGKLVQEGHHVEACVFQQTESSCCREEGKYGGAFRGQESGDN